MLNDAKQRNDVLSQAYATLHEEYVQLRTSHHDDQHLEQPRGAYGGANLVFDPSMGGMTTGDSKLDMDLFVYSDLTGGVNNFSL